MDQGKNCNGVGMGQSRSCPPERVKPGMDPTGNGLGGNTAGVKPGMEAVGKEPWGKARMELEWVGAKTCPTAGVKHGMDPTRNGADEGSRWGRSWNGSAAGMGQGKTRNGASQE